MYIEKQPESVNLISTCGVHYAPTNGAVCYSCMSCIHVWHVSWCGNNHQASSIVRSLLGQSPILVGLSMCVCVCVIARAFVKGEVCVCARVCVRVIAWVCVCESVWVYTDCYDVYHTQ